MAGWLARSRERRSREFDAEAAMAAAAAMVCGDDAVAPASTGQVVALWSGESTSETGRCQRA